MAKWSSPETADTAWRWMAEHSEEGECRVSFPRLAQELGVSETTAYVAVRRLLDHGRLTVARRGTSGNYPTRYRVLEERAVAA